MDTEGQNFYCHQCQRPVSPTSEFTCPGCNGGFIEPMDGRPNDDTVEEDRPVGQVWDRFVSNAHAMQHDPRGAVGGGPHLGLFGLPRFHQHLPARGGGPGRRTTHFRLRHHGNDGGVMEIDLGGERGGAGNMAPDIGGALGTIMQNLFGGADIHFTGGLFPGAVHGNPGDYVTSAAGLDAVITQLLNQMDGAGAPPAPEEQIESLPKVTVTQEMIGDKPIDCAVCFEEMKVGEEAVKLPCEHHYHEPCIKPWLALHNTCPVCRKNLSGESQPENQYPDGLDIGVDLHPDEPAPHPPM